MQTQLACEFAGTEIGLRAQELLSKCVHCGFCLATCPTYQILGDELDSPRGRIYQIKAVFEGQTATNSTQMHLDRCLSCRNCETTCPSGVEYGALLDLGRKVVEERVARPFHQRLSRWLLREGLNSSLFAPLLRLGQFFRPVLPAALQKKIPQLQKRKPLPYKTHTDKVLLLAGCVQPAMAPNINDATMRVLDVLGIETIIATQAGCCGALKYHLNDHDAALQQARGNIDAWWPYVQTGSVQCIVMNASACGLMVKDYAELLYFDTQYAEKAARISALTQDISEYLLAQLGEENKFATLKRSLLPTHVGDKAKVTIPLPRLAYHPPCTLQHGQKRKGEVLEILRRLGFEVELAPQESHLCCGSAGTYSVLQPLLATQLKERKLDKLMQLDPNMIVSANIGCITHLQSTSPVPVRHWIEVIDAALG